MNRMLVRNPHRGSAPAPCWRGLPQGGSQNVIFVGSGYLTQGELYRLGAITTVFSLLVFLVVGTPWILFVTR
jgi:di/tricarboxylate transporter